ncbi:MAG: ATP-binding protein [Dehalococcoidales bacterium]|nr:ATP-binding protein [Dehalococcoidales bacterium]
MIAKNIDQITEEDLQALIDNPVVEHKTLEYKQALPSDSDADKKEFLADVSSFANASGGDLIYGIIEDKKTGTPTSLDGLDIENIGQEILRLDNIMRAGIQPRLPSVNISPPITLGNSRSALVVRVPKSWISPHRVIYGGHDKFYSRSSNGKYPLDVGELRIAFNLSETMTERIRGFRQDRISKILANETPVPFYDTAKIALHLIPIISFNPAQAYDINKIASQPTIMPPIDAHGWYNRYNLDGFLTYSEDQERKTYSYVQLFRNGIIEAVNGTILELGKLTFSRYYEEKLIESFKSYPNILRALTVEPPIFIFLTLLSVKGYSMVVRESYGRTESHTIDRDILPLPEIIIERYDVRAEDVLRPCFDSIWNACGFPRSFNYNDKGEWSPR